MFLVMFLAAGMIFTSPAYSQVEFVGRDPFPAAMEFKEISPSFTEKLWTSPTELARLDQGAILIETGLKRYVERSYVLTIPGSLKIEIMTFADPRESYSAFTFLSGTALKKGPPGDFFESSAEILSFSAGNCLVRIHAQANQNLAARVASSIANRIGRKAPNPPALIRHLPLENCDASSIRYFLAPPALARLGAPVAGTPLLVPAEVEAAQARYAAQGESGAITLLSFPTTQLADEFYDAGPLYASAPKTGFLYTRKTGPIIGILEGNFSAGSADKILSSIKFEYSIKWIFDRNKNQGRTIWGVPVRILSTVVRSLLFTALLCLASIFAGVLLGAGRLYVRRRLGRTDSDAYIRLKIDEN